MCPMAYGSGSGAGCAAGSEAKLKLDGHVMRDACSYVRKLVANRLTKITD